MIRAAMASWPRVRAQLRGPRDLLLAARMGMWAVSLRVLKFIVPLPALVRLVSRSSDRARRAYQEEQVIALARWACRITAWPAQSNCLERALITYRYLGSVGAQPQLVVGLGRSEDGRVRGHAWVVLDGHPIDETEQSLAEYGALAAFDPRGVRLPA